MRDDRLDVKALCLVMALGCNLSCEYCHIAQSRHTHTKANEMQANTIKALQDGTYLANTLKIFERLEQDPKEVEIISFWGQEPTLTLKYWTQNAEAWMKAYPKVFKYEFSTNGMANGDDIIDFCKTLDKYATHNVTLALQFSYDGESHTNDVRGGSSDIISQTIIHVLEELSKADLKKVFVDGAFHAVLSYDAMRKMKDDMDALQTYYTQMDRWANEMKSHISSPGIMFGPKISVNIEHPYDACQQDGIDLLTFVKNSDKIDKSEMSFKFNPAVDMPGSMSEGFKWLYRDGFDSVQEALTTLYEDGEISREMSGHLFCSNNVNELKVMYDGTLVNCQNYIFDMEYENIPKAKTVENEAKRALVSHKYFVNALTDDIDVVWDNIRLFNDLKYESFPFLYQQVCNFMYMLAKCGQIDQSYLTDKAKFFEHAWLLAVGYDCAYNHIIQTGSHLVKQTGYIRQYTNGLLDIASELDRQDKKRMDEGEFLFKDRRRNGPLEFEDGRSCYYGDR